MRADIRLALVIAVARQPLMWLTGSEYRIAVSLGRETTPQSGHSARRGGPLTGTLARVRPGMLSLISHIY